MVIIVVMTTGHGIIENAEINVKTTLICCTELYIVYSPVLTSFVVFVNHKCYTISYMQFMITQFPLNTYTLRYSIQNQIMWITGISSHYCKFPLSLVLQLYTFTNNVHTLAIMILQLYAINFGSKLSMTSKDLNVRGQCRLRAGLYHVITSHMYYMQLHKPPIHDIKS